MECGPSIVESTNDNISEFVRKLSRILENSVNYDIINWTKNGDSFVITDPSGFSETLLPRYYKHKNFASFVRQLNKYGFKKVKGGNESSYGKTSWEFKNAYFKKNQPDLLEYIKRKTSAKPQEPKSHPVLGKLDVSPTTASGSNEEDEEISDLQNRVKYLETCLNQANLKYENLSDQLSKSCATINNLTEANNRQNEVNKVLLNVLCKLDIGAAEKSQLESIVRVEPVTFPAAPVQSGQNLFEIDPNSLKPPLYQEKESNFADLLRSISFNTATDCSFTDLFPTSSITQTPLSSFSTLNMNSTTSVQDLTPTSPLILVVDDDKGARDIIQKFLSKFGFRTEFATNGRNAVKAFKTGKRFSAVIMDLYMPYMDGMEATSQIRTLDKDIPIICVTGNTLPSESDNCLKKGMNAVVHKPVKRDGLFEALGRFFYMGSSVPNPIPAFTLYQFPSMPIPDPSRSLLGNTCRIDEIPIMNQSDAMETDPNVTSSLQIAPNLTSSIQPISVYDINQFNQFLGITK